MIDPITALAGIQSAISMVKKAANVANDLGSLAPMIGKLFDAKSVATKAMLQAKQSGKGSGRRFEVQKKNFKLSGEILETFASEKLAYAKEVEFISLHPINDHAPLQGFHHLLYFHLYPFSICTIATQLLNSCLHVECTKDVI